MELALGQRYSGSAILQIYLQRTVSQTQLGVHTLDHVSFGLEPLRVSTDNLGSST